MWLGKSDTVDNLLQSSLNWTRTDVEAFVSYVETNPLPGQMWSYLNSSSWISSAGSVNVSTECLSIADLTGAAGFPLNPLHNIRVDHCLSQRTEEECRLFYHLPIALAMIICNLIKIVCIWLLLCMDRRDLILTIGDAISPFLQRPDPITKRWCTLSPETVDKDEKCPWNPKRGSLEMEDLCSPDPHPGLLPSYKKSWSAASSGKIWLLTFLVLVLYMIISLALPAVAAQNTVTHQHSAGPPLTAMWQIKGWGEIQSTALLSNLATSFVGMELLANTPQLAVSLLYFCLNNTLTRMILAADYNNFAIHRRSLRVSFPRGEQRSTWYLTIPYQYAIPLLTTFTLIHWFISEGLFYVQILPYSIYGQPVPSAELVTCGVSTLPLELGLFLMIGVFLAIAILGGRKLEASKMPIAREWSVAISAACHSPRHDLDAAFRPVQWGVVQEDTDAVYPHCSFTSKEVKEPEKGVEYA